MGDVNFKKLWKYKKGEFHYTCNETKGCKYKTKDYWEYAAHLEYEHNTRDYEKHDWY